MPRDPWLNLAVTGHIRIVGDSAVAVFTRLLDGVEPSLVDLESGSAGFRGLQFVRAVLA